MRMRHYSHHLILATLLMSATSTVQAEDPVYIAGTVPSERPATAPVITEVHKDGAWYAQSLTGVEQPYPSSLRFLENQGTWFSPFVHAGMPPPYDVRGWHTDK
ncbi:MAG: hypothetical protein KJ914_10870 [Gammaproteobacteria bacterium]|nr:hypothetical protein [Gammaproteobacteria bacterium]MBU1723472.1 hypothetical protein [Gammaproteobacteria bacterium]MBU2004406.1 hypothetical protein [Gammaproteobacteria bacterium]